MLLQTWLKGLTHNYSFIRTRPNYRGSKFEKASPLYPYINLPNQQKSKCCYKLGCKDSLAIFFVRTRPNWSGSKLEKASPFYPYINLPNKHPNVVPISMMGNRDHLKGPMVPMTALPSASRMIGFFGSSTIFSRIRKVTVGDLLINKNVEFPLCRI